jgi:hypothetical protein
MPNDFVTTAPTLRCELHEQDTDARESLMVAARLGAHGWRTSKSKRRSQSSSKNWRASWRETMDDDESAQAEKFDRLLLASLRYWEVERDLIEERVAAIASVIVPS